jgi:type IV pilus assembly protein PilY1
MATCSADAVFAQECASLAADRSAVEVGYETDGAAVGVPSTLLFRVAADGTLRAEDVATGGQLWAYRAPETLTITTPGERMTSLAVLRFDADGDGVIDARRGDRVWLYFGLKRAGSVYYALDVTERTPRVLWRADRAVIPGLGDAWSTPTIARVRIAGTQQNGEHFVVIVGGGFTAPASAAAASAAPGKAAPASAAPGSAAPGSAAPGSAAPGSAAPASAAPGNSLFMLDAASGRVLWSARDRAPADFVSPRMTEAFASRIVAIDFDGDQFADRLYAADVGARVWRFDIWNGRTVDQLVTGGVLASLGAVEPLAASQTPPSAPAPVAASADARRFFNAPDIAYIRAKGEAPYYNLSLGSGDAADLRSAGVQDRFYALRDYAPFRRLSQSEYDATIPVFDGDLSDSGAGPKGWKRDLLAGERVLSDSITVNGVVLFTTFQPAGTTELCEATGTNRVYVVNVENARPALDLDGDTKVTEADLATTLKETHVVGTPRIELVWPDAKRAGGETSSGGGVSPGSPSVPDEAAPRPEAANTRCLIGNEVLRQCVSLGTVVRTFWKRVTIN